MCLQSVVVVEKTRNVLTGRSAHVMEVQYHKVVTNLNKHLPTDKFESLADNFQTKRSPCFWSEDDKVLLVELVQHVVLKEGEQTGSF